MRGSALGQGDAAVGGQWEAGVDRHFPRMPVDVDEDAATVVRVKARIEQGVTHATADETGFAPVRPEHGQQRAAVGGGKPACTRQRPPL